jgi:DNA-binding beta-propeller fold protein YncE
MIRNRLQVLPGLAGLALSLCLAGCGGDSGSGPGPIEQPVFSDVQAVLTPNCNTASCHNSSFRAAGLALETHDQVAAGSRYGATLVPFHPERSHFWRHLTGETTPLMPLGRDPLSTRDLDVIRKWIEQGAVDDSRTPMYAGVTRKAFVACQGENVVAVIDIDTGLTIRHIDVDAPHSVLVDPSTRRVYVTRFETASDNIHVYDADTYQRVATGRAGTFPALMAIVRPAGLGPQLWVTNFDTSGGDDAVRILDPTSLTEITSIEVAGATQPHGIAVTTDQTKVYVTNIGSGDVTIFGTSPAPSFLEGPVDLPAAGSAHQPQQCVLSKDEKYLFVSALGTDGVYVMDTTTLPPSFIPSATIATGDAPWHLTLSPDGARLWVANWLGSSVTVANCVTATSAFVERTLAPTHPVDITRPALQRPIGITFSPDGSRVYVASANDDNRGSGHHPPPGGEKNPGNVTILDAQTYEVLSVAEVPNFARFVSLLP